MLILRRIFSFSLSPLPLFFTRPISKCSSRGKVSLSSSRSIPFVNDKIKENQTDNENQSENEKRKSDITAKESTVTENIENIERISIQEALSKLQSENNKLYCKVMIYSFPFTVTLSDLITLHRLKNVPIGSRILLSQIKEIGSPSFSLKGNPWIDPKFIRVEATVMSHGRGSKVSAAPKYQRKGRRPVKNLKPHITTLRISRIQINEDDNN